MMNGRSMLHYLQTIYQMCQSLNIGASYQQMAYALGVRSGNLLAPANFLRQVAELTIEAERAGLDSSEIQALLTSFAAGGLTQAHAAIHEQARRDIIARTEAIDELFEEAQVEDERVSAVIEQRIIDTATAIQEIREHAKLDKTIDPEVVNVKLETLMLEDAPPAPVNVQEKMNNYVTELKKDEDFQKLENLVKEYEEAKAAMEKQAADSPDHAASNKKLGELAGNISQLAGSPRMAARINQFGQNAAPMLNQNMDEETLKSLSAIARILELAMGIKGSPGFGPQAETPDASQAPMAFYKQNKDFRNVLNAAVNFGNS